MPLDPDALLATLTLAQKVALLAGSDGWHTERVPGVPVLRCTDGPAGARGTSWNGPRSASFPCSTALGASFDPELVEEVGRALGREARSKGAQMLLAPTVNLHRTPIGGRNFECMSEDPTLTAHLAVAYVKGVQSQRVASCIKHFVANDTEFQRRTISSDVDERTLRELYLLPFEAAVRPVDEGGADVRTVMSSYNRINGTYASDHEPLLRGVLRDDWGYDGVVISDWYGTNDGVASLRAGLDLEMPGPPRQRGDALLAAVEAGQVSESLVDESVRRLLALFSWCGLDDPAEGWTTDERTDDSVETRALIRRAASAGTVLLQNRSDPEGTPALPLARGVRVALIGPNAERGQIQGGGSAQVRANRPVGLLTTLRDRGVDVSFAQGCSISKRLPPLRGAFDITYLDDAGDVATVPAERLQFMWMDSPAPGVDRHAFGVRLSGTFTPQVTGEWTFGVVAVGAAVLRVNGQTVVDLSVPQTGGAFFGMGSPEVRGVVVLEEGVVATVEVEQPFTHYTELRGLFVGAAGPEVGDTVADAAAVAAEADVAVVVVGTDAEWETEGEDRTTMDLPGRQDELIARVAAANPNTIVVINAGSPVTMPWLDDAAAVLQVWFPGEEMGNAIADVLFGDVEPGGRLPMSIPRRLEDTPAFLSHPGDHGHAPYGEGLFIGYRWYDARDIAPVFPFGHGLGYTTWDVGAAEVTGSLSLGQMGIVGIGAAVAATCTSRWHVDLSLALLAGGAAGGVAAFVVGVPALRLRGLYLAVTTFAFGLTVQFWLLNDRFFGWFPRSDQRLQRPPLFGRISIDSPTRFYVYSVVVLALVSLGVRGVRRSRTGRVIVALRENERAAQSFAVPLVRAKLTAFVLSGVVAGVGGALFVHLNQSFVVASYDTGQSFSVFTAAVVGGLGSVGGAFLGALYLRGTQWFITSQEWQVLSSGVGVLVVLLVLPSGLGGLWVRLRDLVVSRLVRAAPVTEPADPGDAAGTIAPEVA